MDSARPQSDTRNIPHMQLFHYLKQKFPDLKDNDVNESIQKYGLDRERCEEELSQKTKLHHGGYYGPWGRSRSSSALSSPAMSRVTSPIRSGVPSPTSTPTSPILSTTTSPGPPPLHHSTATHHVFGPLHSSGYLVYSYSPDTMVGGGTEPVYTSPTTTAAVATSPMFYQPPINSPVNYGWHSHISNGFNGPSVQFLPARHVPGLYSRQDSPYGSRETSKSRSSTPVLPKSAPVVPNSFDPFGDYEVKGTPERRKSAETQYVVRRQQNNTSDSENQYDERLENSPLHSPSPPPNVMDSPATLTATTTTTLTTSTSNSTSPSTVNGSSSSGRPPPGRRHVSSIFLTPVPPHGAHHAPGPPSSDGTVSVCGRSYTSVNLQLRQPCTEPQPPIQIRSSGSSLTYSTSSLDHRHGSRSSLQISIGPTGGTISAMRTNLDNKNSQANTAFHIQYSSSANEGPSPTGAVFPTTGDVVGQEGVQEQVRRPQSWYVPDSTDGGEHKSSLPECVGPPVSLHLLHYPPPTTDSTLGYSSEDPMLPPTGPDSSHVQGIVCEQMSRKGRLEAEMAQQVEEKARLEREVDMMLQELHARENQRKIAADTNTKRIEDVQKENQRLQSECYEMENRILRLAPDMEPEVGLSLPSPQAYPDTPQPPPPLLPRASSGSSLGSGTSGTPQTPSTPGSYVPIRPAPPPPPLTPTTHIHNHHPQGVGGEGGGDDPGHKWGCSKCTFINHPDMNKCEICDYPRFTIVRELP